MPKLKGQLPLNSYPTKGDSEVIPEGLPTPNPAMAGNVTGTGANHSSLVMSIPPMADGNKYPAEGAQWNDDEDGGTQGHLDIDTGDDPNLSGPKATQPLHDWHTPKASSWQENDDYLDFTWDTNNVPESRLFNHGPARYGSDENDYDDQGDIVGTPRMNPDPYAETRSGPNGAFGDDTTPADNFGSGPSFISGITVYPIVRRK